MTSDQGVAQYRTSRRGSHYKDRDDLAGLVSLMQGVKLNPCLYSGGHIRCLWNRAVEYNRQCSPLAIIYRVGRFRGDCPVIAF